jgi:ribosomal protein L16/L10AE
MNSDRQRKIEDRLSWGMGNKEFMTVRMDILEEDLDRLFDMLLEMKKEDNNED